MIAVSLPATRSQSSLVGGKPDGASTRFGRHETQPEEHEATAEDENGTGGGSRFTHRSNALRWLSANVA